MIKILTHAESLAVADEFVRLQDDNAKLHSALMQIAAECHRAKWTFDLSDDYKPTAAVARSLIAGAFDELHRIGGLAMKYGDTSPVPSNNRGSE